MNRPLARALCALGLSFGVMTEAGATLFDRGGGLIYDDVLDITWLQDANYGAGSIYDNGGNTTDGLMTWANALDWAADLSYYDSVRGVTYADWRLPTVAAIDGSTFNYSFSYDGSTDNGWHISDAGTTYAGATGSELAYMFYNNLLGYESSRNTDGSLNLNWPGDFSPDFTDGTSGLTKSFHNLEFNDLYWSGTDYAPTSIFAWIFYTYGYQKGGNKFSLLSAWAVRDGDVAAAGVPEPGTAVLLGAGLLPLVGRVLRRRHSGEKGLGSEVSPRI